MKSALECIPCLLKQTLYTARLSTNDAACQAKIMRQVATLLGNIDLQQTPPENSMPIYQTISRLSGCTDPFADLKKESNHFATAVSKESRKIITKAEDPLFAALLFSIAGNIIDYGSQQDFDAKAALENCLHKPLILNDYEDLVEQFQNSKKILYLADNAGEIVFDKLVIETMLTMAPDKEIVVAVKDGPIINDALMADAKDIGLTEICPVISNGVCCPGTPLPHCSEQFQQAFNQADLIISKGQGNFETLSLVDGPIFFLLTIKCAIIDRHITDLTGREVALGDMVLFQR